MDVPIGDDWIERLQQTSTFGGMDAGAIRLLLELGRQRSVAAQEPVYLAGDHPDAIFLVVEGRVEVAADRGKGSTRWCFDPNQVFGDISMAAMRPRSCTATALRPTRLIEIDAGALHRLYEQDPRQYTLLMMNMGRNFSRLLLDERQAPN